MDQDTLRPMNAPSTNAAPPTPQTPESPGEKSRAPSKSILLVEDDQEFSGALRMFLEAHAFEVFEARDGGEAVRRIMTRDYDVILCDMVMPNFPGDMFYRAVERTKPYLCRRFIFMTGYRGDQKIIEFVGKIGGYVLWKPFEFRVMLEAIHTIEGRVPRRAR